MSPNLARLEAQLNAIARRQFTTDTNVEEVRQEMMKKVNELESGVEASYQKITLYFDRSEKELDERFSKIDERFSKIDEQFSKIDERFSKVDERFDKIEKRLDVIEANMVTKEELKEELKAFATKEDLKALETRILDAFQQVITLINEQRPQR